MNPVIIIPTYVGKSRGRENANILENYDHVTPLGYQGELPRCLVSLRDNGIDIPVFVLVVSEKGIEQQASAKVKEIVTAVCQQSDDFNNVEKNDLAATLDVRIIDASTLAEFYNHLGTLGLSGIRDGVGLKSYGSIRNLGLLVAAAGGYTECIFIDDDEIIDAPNFLEDALYGMGKISKSGVPVLVKSGFHTDRRGNWKSTQKSEWYNRYWFQGELFNKWITKAMNGARLSDSNSLYGGLCAIHREAWRRVSFDAWIPRGEDLDYLLNLRMFGGNVWFDNQWRITHLPPKTKDESQRFRQDIYRWTYESYKLEFAKSQIDLMPIQPHSLEPYPGPYLEPSINKRVFVTALLRMIGRSSYRHGYYKAAMTARKEARAYAEEFCPRYYEFQHGWPQIVSIAEGDPQIGEILSGRLGAS
ncbi:MAG: hypothetical protein LBG97_02715 [Coriobacteriales bacterium]|nr:hypothetical protein [Coriobacteriales bacterium]